MTNFVWPSTACGRKAGSKRSGRRHQVCGQVEEPSGQDRQVVVISPLKQAEQSHNSLKILDRLRDSLSRAGTSVNVRTVPALAAKRPGRRLEELVESSPHALWVLHQAGRPTQEWFLRSGLPTAVLGTSLEDLPGVDLDHLAMAHHCIGLLRRRLRGEPRVILFRTGPGDDRSGEDRALDGTGAGGFSGRDRSQRK